MTIVIVNDFGFANGGTSQVAISSAVALKALGYNVIWYCAVGPIAPQLTNANIETHCLNQAEIAAHENRWQAASQGLWNTKAERTLSALLATQAVNPTVVHVHGWSKALSPSIFKAIANSHLPAAVTLHDFFAACPNGGFYNYQNETICHLKPLSLACVCSNCDKRSYPQKLWRVGRQHIMNHCSQVAGGVKHFIAVSEFSLSKVRAHLDPAARFHMVRNPVDISRKAPAKPAQSDYYLFVGRLSPEKGGVIFAQAAKQLGLKAIFVGEGEERERIKEVHPNARITGWQSVSDTHNAISRARALIFPSRWYETQGLVVAEAAALGVPSIVASTSAAAESIVIGESGLLFDSSSANDLAAKLVALQDNGLVEKLGTGAYENYWRNPPTLESHTRQLTKVYEMLLSSDAAARPEHFSQHCLPSVPAT